MYKEGNTYKKILGPLDGSKLSECSLEHIKTIATGCHVSEVVLLAVLEPVTLSFGGAFGSREMIERSFEQSENAEKENLRKAQDYLAHAADSLKKDGIQVQTEILTSELGVAESILNYSQSHEVDLIILSTHGRSGVSRFAFGSVADKVVRYAKVPVLTITPISCREQ